MWRLLDTQGKSVGVCFWDQWEACKTCYHKDGRAYRRFEALALKESTIVYRKVRKKQFFKLPVIMDGKVVDELTRTSADYELVPYRLVKVS